MFTVEELIQCLLRLDQKGMVLMGCMWTKEDIREYIEDNFDMPKEESDAMVSDDDINELMLNVDSKTDFISNEDVYDAIYSKFGNLL